MDFINSLAVQINPGEMKMVFQVVLAALLGSFVGFEREYTGKAAGLRTYALVCLGAALFTILSKSGFNEFVGISSFDPSRIASQIVVGIGFIGAGLIIFREQKIEGLTTAAGLWAMAAVGMAIGIGYYLLAVFASLLIFIVLSLFGKLKLEERLHKKAG